MQRSEQINELAASLSKAQAVIEGAVKDKTNPAFRSKYADLGAVWDAIREPLAKNNLSVAQFPRRAENGVEVETILLHSSGQWMSETLSMPVAKADAHGVGGAITYARRFALSALMGVAPVDDDGLAAVGKPAPAKGAAEQDWAQEAVRDGLATTTESKYQTDKVGVAKEYVANAIQTLNLSPNKEMAKEWWRDQAKVPAGKKKSPIDWLKDNSPDQFQRLQTCYENVVGME